MEEVCTLTYIPDRLHSTNKQPITQFSVGEFLFRRCKPEELANPFAAISLTELSHNRSGLREQALSLPDDVLFNILENDPVEIYELEVCPLEIIDLNESNQYSKFFEEEKNGERIIVRMDLLHDPAPCMYPHCIFRIWVGDIVVNFDNYKASLGRYNQIRTKIREELASMIVTKNISQESCPLI